MVLSAITAITKNQTKLLYLFVAPEFRKKLRDIFFSVNDFYCSCTLGLIFYWGKKPFLLFSNILFTVLALFPPSGFARFSLLDSGYTLNVGFRVGRSRLDHSLGVLSNIV